MNVITGLFSTPPRATAAVRDLEARGVRPSDISLVVAEGTGRESFGIDSKTKVAEGAAIGAGIGGAAGALILGLTSVGAIASGGVGLLAAGPLVAALAGAGAGAAAGGAVGTVVGLNIPETEIKFYDDALREGSALVGVQCNNSHYEEIIESTLKSAGAVKVSRA